MMRFRKGSKVEVWSLKEGPSRSWCCAEIIGINNRHYTVRYEGDIKLHGKPTVEKVSRKMIRPCPPPMDVLQDWVNGDVVEVFHNFSWKMATILKVLGYSHFLVRLLGLAVDIEADRYDIRARLCWQDGEWIAIGKASNKCDDLRFRFPSSRNDTKQPRKRVTFVSRHMKNDNELTNESQAMQLKTTKRKLPNVHSRVEGYAKPNKKIKLGNKEINAMQQSQLPEKVGNVISSRELLHEISIHPSLNNKIQGGSEMFVEREKTYFDAGYSRSKRLELNDDTSVSSSVASCSVNRNPSHELRHVFASGHYEDHDSQSSDAESFCQLRFKEEKYILPSKEVLTDEIHRLELHAYRCTIGALYASGPLSWEQELFLTNLRDSLNVTNDEHLREIRNLISSNICIPIS